MLRCVLLLLLALPAQAGDRLETLRALNTSAAAAFSSKDYVEALTLYESLEVELRSLGRLEDLAIVRVNMGQCLEKTDRPVEALIRYRQGLEGPLPEALRAQVETRVKRLDGARLEVSCGPPVEQVEISGVTRPCGSVFELPPGRYAVLGLNGQSTVAHAAVDLARAERRRINLDPPSRDEEAGAGSNVAALGLTLGAAALGIVGVSMNIAARSNLDEADGLYDDFQDDPANSDELPGRIQSLDDRANTLVIGSYVAYGVAAALGGTALFFWFDGTDEGMASGGLSGRW